MKQKLKWGAGIILLIAGIGLLLQGQILPALFYSIGGLICLPPTLLLVESRIKKTLTSGQKYVIVVISLLLGGLTAPKIPNKDNKPNADKSKDQKGNNIDAPAPTNGNNANINEVALNPDEYEIMKTQHLSDIQNFYVFVKKTNFDEGYLKHFTEQFKNKHCTMRCNVFLYDKLSVSRLLNVHPLNAKQYVEMADHFIFATDFGSGYGQWYPLQDWQYKEYGGKNWKKTPIE